MANVKKSQSDGSVDMPQVDDEESFEAKVEETKRASKSPFRPTFVRRGTLIDDGDGTGRRRTAAKYGVEDEDVEDIIMRLYTTDASNQNSY